MSYGVILMFNTKQELSVADWRVFIFTLIIIGVVALFGSWFISVLGVVCLEKYKYRRNKKWK